LPRAYKLLTFVGFVASMSGLGCSTLFPGSQGSDSSSPTETKVTGCSTSTKHVAPGGYYVNGNTICTAAGEPHQLHGVDRPSMEWSSSGVNITAADFQRMASWKANVVRIALNQDFWLPGGKYSNPHYPALVATAVSYAEEAGMDVILDLHWSDKGVLGSCNPMDGCQQAMADANNSIPFWSQVATQFKDDGRVFFELYNEPHDIAWDVWKSGGMVAGWMAAGMQQLYDTVRAAGADNLVIVGGVQYAYDLTGVPDNRITGYNIIYATHPYNNNPDSKPAGFDNYWGFLTATDPVVVTEFGDPGGCSGDTYGAAVNTYESAVISYADAHHASWTAWAWYPSGCSFPSLISDWNGTPTPPGTVVQAALAGYDDPAYGGKKSAPSPGDGGASDAGGSAADGATAADAGAPDGGG
jgi:endoglucanase